MTNFLLIVFSVVSMQDTFFLDLLSLSINFVFTVIIFYKALSYSDIFDTIPSVEIKQKYELSRLTEQEKQVYLSKLFDYFDREKPFLDQEMTISVIAARLGIPVKYLSQVINESVGKNFYDFVNSYRVDHAKALLSQEGDSPRTVLEILYESGFNSKSVFNLAFKKYTGYTPREFKKLSSTS